MKTQILNYVFNKTAKTVTFTDVNPIRLDAVLTIFNVTRGTIMYSIGDPTKIATVATNILTLNDSIDTSGMNDADKLLIYYDDSLASIKNNPLPLRRSIDEVTNSPKGFTPVNLTASGQILNSPGTIDGFFVNTSSGGSIRISDALTATTPYLGAAFIPTAGQYYKFPANLTIGGYVTIGVAAIDVTFFVLPNEILE